jgi:hypothetical protein
MLNGTGRSVRESPGGPSEKGEIVNVMRNFLIDI